MHAFINLDLILESLKRMLRLKFGEGISYFYTFIFKGNCSFTAHQEHVTKILIEWFANCRKTRLLENEHFTDKYLDYKKVRAEKSTEGTFSN